MVTLEVSTRSRPKATVHLAQTQEPGKLFQHAAARRRLRRLTPWQKKQGCFNTQPPEGD
ncbi:hypothetical protein HMPREF9098_0570 [Kingella denitrificans ATCC 33394]|uniref:Uncharacterized protein n=1 Tax=Kingella denitrificans ATCC 33394 TaxID=888741 RepID=F0EXI6_9NEIS|nr:hypothetical protein HMPREF9098_0570 [Kingella denitrificans ATCC 33394]